MFNLPNYNYGYQPQSNGIIWVQGEAGAKSYNILPNQSVLLMDSENNVFYIKSSDISGMPKPLRIFDYTERVPVVKAEQPVAEKVEYVTREEFEKKIAEITNAKQSVQSTERKQQQH